MLNMFRTSHTYHRIEDIINQWEDATDYLSLSFSVVFLGPGHQPASLGYPLRSVESEGDPALTAVKCGENGGCNGPLTAAVNFGCRV